MQKESAKKFEQFVLCVVSYVSLTQISVYSFNVLGITSCHCKR